MRSKRSISVIYIIYIITTINMAVMVSDYKAICNKVGAVCTLLLMLLLIYYYHGKLSYPRLERRLMLSVVLFLSYFTLTSLIKGSIANTVESVIYYLIEFSSIFMILYFEKNGDNEGQKILLVIFFFLWDVFCLLSIYTYIKSPSIARLMAAYRSSYSSMIIGGGYPLAYGSAILGVYLLQNIIEYKNQNRNFRIAAIAEIALLTILVYFTDSFVILVSMLLGYLLCIFRHTFKGSFYIISMVSLFVITLVIFFNIQSVLEWLLNINNNDFIEKRLYEWYNLVANDVTSYHLDKRSGLYEMSIQTFLQHPIIGVGYKFGNLGSLQRTFGVGAHSTILDSLAQYGLVGSIPLFSIILYPFHRNGEKKYSSIYLLVFAFMLFLNPCFTTYHCLLIVYLIVPLLQKFLEIR